VPLECEYFALRGVALLKTTIDKVRERLNPKLEIDGVLGTMFDGRTLHGREVMEPAGPGLGRPGLPHGHPPHREVLRLDRAGEPITSYAVQLGRCRALPPARQGGARRWPDLSTTREPAGRRRPVPADRPDSEELAAEAHVRAVPDATVTRRPAARTTPRASAGRAGGCKHDEKMTVYVTSDELLDLEHARLVLRRDHGLAVDRGRLVREAVALVLADLDENGVDSCSCSA
jgi:hypothetical protein